MKPSQLLTLALASLLFAVAPHATAQQIVVAPDRASGIYGVGDTVRWKVEWKGDAPVPPARYTLKSNGLKEVGQGDVKFVENVATLETKFDAPGAILVEVRPTTSEADNKIVGTGGAVADWDKIQPAAPPPDDFDAFWAAKIAELRNVPPKPKLEPGESGKPGVEYWKLTLDNIRGTHINAQLARPQQGEKFPALLIVQWAGVYPLQKPWAVDRAADGWLALNVMPHDLPIDQPETFYKDQYAGPLKNYWAIGNEDPDTSYYLRMYLSCVRAVEYLKTRPDWDGKTLVVMGTSQGGQQTLVTAGLCADSITAALAFVPAACDMLAPDLGRASGFPNWYFQTHDGRDAQKVRSTSRYYDPLNFARRIKCPTLIGVGLRDDVSPPSSVFAAANVVTAPKEVFILPTSGHQDENGTQKPYNDRAYGSWLPALQKGQPAPVSSPPRPGAAANDEDHRRMLALLKIDSLRPGPSGNPQAPNAANTDESRVKPYTLPDPLVMNDGTPVTTAQQWRDRRRPELLELFDREIYGRVPKDAPPVKWEVRETTRTTHGTVPSITKQLLGHVDNAAHPQLTVDIRLSLTVPANATGRVPVVMEFSFGPRPFGAGPTTRRAATLAASQPAIQPWQQLALDRGWAYATLVPTSIQPDNGAGLTQGVIGLANRGQPRKPDDWGALRAWAWGAGRALDYFESDPTTDPRRVAISGLSRYGKAALVAMAYDDRFAAALVASSGAGGAKILRRTFGEQVENLASPAEYHWFAGNFLKYAGPLTPSDLPVDAHELIALCAPRPVFISAGSPTVEGGWIDANGSFLATVAAGPVYRLLGKRDLGATEIPPIETALVTGELAFRQHTGGHTTGPNWPAFFDYAARYFDGAQPSPAPVTAPR